MLNRLRIKMHSPIHIPNPQTDLSSVKNLQIRKLYCDETKLCLQKWNPRPRKRFRKLLRKQMLTVPSRKGHGRFIHDELVVAEAPRKQSQLTTHERKLKNDETVVAETARRPRGRQVGLEENYRYRDFRPRSSIPPTRTQTQRVQTDLPQIDLYPNLFGLILIYLE